MVKHVQSALAPDEFSKVRANKAVEAVLGCIEQDIKQSCKTLDDRQDIQHAPPITLSKFGSFVVSRKSDETFDVSFKPAPNLYRKLNNNGHEC